MLMLNSEACPSISSDFGEGGGILQEDLKSIGEIRARVKTCLLEQ